MHKPDMLLANLRRTTLSACLAVGLALGTAMPADRALATAAPIARSSLRKTMTAASAIHRPAITVEVTNCNDGGNGSLRNALFDLDDGDVVDLTHLACSAITLTQGALNNQKAVTLQGPGADRLTISAYNLSGVIESFSPGTLTLSGLTIANGRYADDTFPRGGCIYTVGSVQLNDVVVDTCTLGNATSAGTETVKGGGIFARLDVGLLRSTVTNSSVTSHSASASAIGGGIYAGRSLTTFNSTIMHDSASLTADSSSTVANGGGAFVYGSMYIGGTLVAGNIAQQAAGLLVAGCEGTSAIVDSTVSDNTSTNTRFGGGVFAGCNTEIRNSTISGNTETNTANVKYGAGVCVGNGFSAYIESSIVANNEFVSTAGSQSDDIMGGAGAGISGSHDIIRFSGLTVPADTNDEDPMLGPLADNGGPTMTHAILAGSPAIDAGANPAGLSTDQRGAGFPRSVGPATDIGAFEYSPVADAIFEDGFEGAARATAAPAAPRH